MKIEFDVPATMRDGTALLSDIYRPEGSGPWPVLLCRMPYGKNAGPQSRMVDPLRLSRRGFIVVLQDVRGRFASEGEWEPWTHESEDGYDSVRWAAQLPLSTGSVGMFGGSYLGNTQWVAAFAGPPELAAIAPAITFADPENGVFRRGGAEELGLALPWALAQGIDTVRRRHRSDPKKSSEAVASIVRDLDEIAERTYWELPSSAHPAYDRHQILDLGGTRAAEDRGWVERFTVEGRQASAKIPSLHVSGWYDVFLQGTLDNFAAMQDAALPSNLIVGPWTHTSTMSSVGDVDFGVSGGGEVVGFRGSLTDIHAAWFSHHLSPKNPDRVDGGAAGLPPVLLFVMGKNEWREEPAWPLERAVNVDYYLGESGTLTLECPTDKTASDTYTYDPADPVPTTGGGIQMAACFRAGPLDQRDVEAREDVLVYDSPPLSADTEVTGRVTATLYVQTDAPSTDWVVRLCDVDEKGVSRNVVDGVVRADGCGGDPTEQLIDLWSTSYEFPAGHRIRIQITSSNFPRWDRNPNTGDASSNTTTLRVAHQRVFRATEQGASRITLPIVPR